MIRSYILIILYDYQIHHPIRTTEIFKLQDYQSMIEDSMKQHSGALVCAHFFQLKHLKILLGYGYVCIRRLPCQHETDSIS